MRTIRLDGSNAWKSPLDFYEALLASLDAPPWHGRNINALIDSMVYGSMNGVEQPYKIWVVGIEACPADVRAEIELIVQAIDEAQGTDRQILFQLDP